MRLCELALRFFKLGTCKTGGKGPISLCHEQSGGQKTRLTDAGTPSGLPWTGGML